ncbi:Proline--tRNA ligase [Caenorhabditis elegans]|uniref:Proline--tRNA ligase n=1 Tax=Caenorhabditis elegans TaxID=6239 RepID=A5JYY0_CAEEL|nr:Proline--tRNA ligase [Caenorhabditis elegans]CAN86903.1 Proline--tRNA ligase [Caenorhabditis elegans]|eukprot:NP_001122525.1 Prolyl Amino-acyl tRNA Synthetase [Caenorhabditis elegans]
MLFKARKWILSGASAQKSKSMAHTMLVENGFILPTAKGFYSLLPLGQRVIDKLCRILDVEFQNSGALKIAMPIVGTQQLWEKTGRWEAMGPEMIRFHDRQQNHMCLQVANRRGNVHRTDRNTITAQKITISPYCLSNR